MIHLNGTGAETLRDGYLNARASLMDALEAMQKIEFNARDYYTQEEGAWSAALAEQKARFEKVESVRDDFLEIAEHCQNAIDEKEARRREREAKP